jgi:hypothetical protein
MVPLLHISTVDSHPQGENLLQVNDVTVGTNVGTTHYVTLVIARNTIIKL